MENSFYLWFGVATVTQKERVGQLVLIPPLNPLKLLPPPHFNSTWSTPSTFLSPDPFPDCRCMSVCWGELYICTDEDLQPGNSPVLLAQLSSNSTYCNPDECKRGAQRQRSNKSKEHAYHSRTSQQNFHNSSQHHSAWCLIYTHTNTAFTIPETQHIVCRTMHSIDVQTARRF